MTDPGRDEPGGDRPQDGPHPVSAWRLRHEHRSEGVHDTGAVGLAIGDRRAAEVAVARRAGASRVRSPGEVSVALSGWVVLCDDAARRELEDGRGSRPDGAGSWRSCDATRPATADTCGVAIEVPWMVE